MQDMKKVGNKRNTLHQFPPKRWFTDRIHSLW